MKWIKEFGIIIVIQYLAEILVKSLSIPFPGSVLGMGILLILLLTKVIKINQVENVGDFLLSILIILYVPAGVGIVQYLDKILPIFLPILITIIISTMITMIVTGHIVQFLINFTRRKENA